VSSDARRLTSSRVPPLPQWMSTHPIRRTGRRGDEGVAGLQTDLARLAVNRPEYLRRLDGMMFGEKPREGFFQDASSATPTWRSGWTSRRDGRAATEKQAVGAVSRRGRHRRAATGAGPDRAAGGPKVLSQQGHRVGTIVAPADRRVCRGDVRPFGSDRARLLRGLVAWIDYRSASSRFLGIPRSALEPVTATCLPRRSTASAGRPPAWLNVQPRRLKIVDLNRAATLETLLRDYPSTVNSQTCLINNLQGEASLSAATSSSASSAARRGSLRRASPGNTGRGRSQGP